MKAVTARPRALGSTTTVCPRMTPSRSRRAMRSATAGRESPTLSATCCAGARPSLIRKDYGLILEAANEGLVPMPTSRSVRFGIGFRLVLGVTGISWPLICSPSTAEITQRRVYFTDFNGSST